METFSGRSDLAQPFISRFHFRRLKPIRRSSCDASATPSLVLDTLFVAAASPVML